MYDMPARGGRDKAISKLRSLKKDNVVRKELVKKEDKEAHRENLDALHKVIHAGKQALEDGQSFEKVKGDMMEAMHIVLGMKKFEEEYKEEKKEKKEKPAPFKHKGQPADKGAVYIRGLLRPAT